MSQSNEDFQRFLKKLNVSNRQEDSSTDESLSGDDAANDELHPDSPIRKMQLYLNKPHRKPSNQK